MSRPFGPERLPWIPSRSQPCSKCFGRGPYEQTRTTRTTPNKKAGRAKNATAIGRSSPSLLGWPALHPLGRSPRDPPALARSRLRSRPSGHRRERRTEGLRPSEPPLNLPAIWHTAHGTIRGAVVVAPLTPFHVCQIHSRLGQGKGRWELALTSTLFPVWSSASPARQFRSR